jgi:hypothetical protein
VGGGLIPITRSIRMSDRGKISRNVNQWGKGGPLPRGLAGLGCAITLAAGLVAACGGAPAAKAAGQPPTAAAPAPSIAPLSEWQRVGATEVPPASLQVVSLQGVEVVDEAGSVSTADARAWAGAYVRSLSYLEWAVSRGQDVFLLRSGLSSVPEVAFQPNVNDIAQARQVGAHVEYQRETIRRLVVRAVPPGLQATFQRQRFAWQPFAVFIDAIGPAANVWVDAQGRRTVKSQMAAGTAANELVGGAFAKNPLLGDIWVTGSDWDCTSPNARQALASLCNP